MHIIITPQHPRIDTELAINIVGLTPGAHLTVRAHQQDLGGRTWNSSASFVARPDGTVDLTRDETTDGTYSGRDPMGLIWSMTTEDEPKPPADPLQPTILVIEASSDDTTATATITRDRVATGLTRSDVTDDGLVGVVWRPDGSKARPAVILLGGAEGGLHEDDAALLAAHGFVVLALAYYGMPGLPDVLENVPLEYFQRAIAFVQALPYVGKLGIAGGSKGGEAALLVAATYPEIAAAASVVGSGIVTQGIGSSVFTGTLLDIMRDPTPNWTYDGEVLPFLPNVVTPELEKAVGRNEAISLRMAFEPGLALTDLVAAATIPVERINGPVLLVSTSDDRGYGRPFHDVAADRLAAHHREYTHLVLEDAGHLIAAPPYGPTTVSQGPGPGVMFDHGGTAAGTAHARVASWHALLDFFRDALVAD